MFLGEFQHTMDSKGRVVIPSKFREELQQGCVITKGQDNCLQILTKNNWENEASKMASLPSTDRTSRQLKRALFSGAIDVKIDSAGRVQIPENLRVYSGIDINEDVTVTVNPLPQAVISGGGSVCDDGSTIEVQIITTGGTPNYNISYNAGITNKFVADVGSPFIINTSESGTYTISAVSYTHLTLPTTPYV